MRGCFRIALTEKTKLFIKQKHSQDCSLSILLSPFDAEILFIFILRKFADKALKNHYIILNKVSINKGKNICKKQVCNQQ